MKLLYSSTTVLLWWPIQTTKFYVGAKQKWLVPVWFKLTKEKRREYVSVSLAQNFLKACNNANNIIVAGKAEISECL